MLSVNDSVKMLWIRLRQWGMAQGAWQEEESACFWEIMKPVVDYVIMIKE